MSSFPSSSQRPRSGTLSSIQSDISTTTPNTPHYYQQQQQQQLNNHQNLPSLKLNTNESAPIYASPYSASSQNNSISINVSDPSNNTIKTIQQNPTPVPPYNSNVDHNNKNENDEAYPDSDNDSFTVGDEQRLSVLMLDDFHLSLPNSPSSASHNNYRGIILEQPPELPPRPASQASSIDNNLSPSPNQPQFNKNLVAPLFNENTLQNDPMLNQQRPNQHQQTSPINTSTSQRLLQQAAIHKVPRKPSRLDTNPVVQDVITISDDEDDEEIKEISGFSHKSPQVPFESHQRLQSQINSKPDSNPPTSSSSIYSELDSELEVSSTVVQDQKSLSSGQSSSVYGPTPPISSDPNNPSLESLPNPIYKTTNTSSTNSFDSTSSQIKFSTLSPAYSASNPLLHSYRQQQVPNTVNQMQTPVVSQHIPKIHHPTPQYDQVQSPMPGDDLLKKYEEELEAQQTLRNTRKPIVVTPTQADSKSKNLLGLFKGNHKKNKSKSSINTDTSSVKTTPSLSDFNDDDGTFERQAEHLFLPGTIQSNGSNISLTIPEDNYSARSSSPNSKGGSNKAMNRLSAFFSGSSSGNQGASKSSYSSQSYTINDNQSSSPYLNPDSGTGPASSTNLSVPATTTTTGRNRSASGSSVNIAETFSPQVDAKLQHAIDLHEAGDIEQATSLFKDLADPTKANHPLAQVLYGLSLRHGWGTEPNQKLAFEYLKLAGTNSALLDHLISENLPLNASNGGVTQASQLIPASTQAKYKGGIAKGELTLAIFELGNCFRFGWGCEKDPQQALIYYETAAKLGDPDAMYETGWCYLNNFGVPPSSSKESPTTATFNPYSSSLPAATKVHPFDNFKGKHGKIGSKKDNKFVAAQYFRMAEEKGKKEVGNSWIWKDKYNL